MREYCANLRYLRGWKELFHYWFQKDYRAKLPIIFRWYHFKGGIKKAYYDTRYNHIEKDWKIN